ncbi:MAG: hypothetical protein GY784_14610 [Gammaproteobacteria bacterium]|nr:hypothetical protein [Gammaproteobacteria bacterium]
MLVRLILLIILVMAILWLLKRLFSSKPDQTDSTFGKSPEDMRQCKFCGTHVPESLTIISNDQPYCSQEHADRDKP